MPKLRNVYTRTDDLVLGQKINLRVPEADQRRQLAEVDAVLGRLKGQPGVIVADEVGMGKTFVALGIAYSLAVRSPVGPVIVMVPANLVDKWEQDLKTFCELYIRGTVPVRRDQASRGEFTQKSGVLRYGVARHSIELLQLMDDPPRRRCQLIFLAQGAMARRSSDKWISLALIAEALRRHGRGKATRLIQVKEQIHRFLAELLKAIGEERVTDLGAELWRQLLKTSPEAWKDIYNRSVTARPLDDDPVPKTVVRTLARLDLGALAEALKEMPVRAKGGDERLSERITQVRRALKDVSDDLWKQVLAESRWRSPLLVMDEAHHLKNAATRLARQFQQAASGRIMKTGDGAMAQAFDRMLFLTATPFQLGHSELVCVLNRFADIRWDESALGAKSGFGTRMEELSSALNESQRTAVALQRSWSALRDDDVGDDVDLWWDQIMATPPEALNPHQRAVVDAFHLAKKRRDAAGAALGPWVVRHNKEPYWVGTVIPRRKRLEGAAIADGDPSIGLAVPSTQLLPFFLAARSAVTPGKDLLGEALSSSFEAFRDTRSNNRLGKDLLDEDGPAVVDLPHSAWYLDEFGKALERAGGAAHPKVSATVKRVVDLWEAGEKVLVFAFYKLTCHSLRIHISEEIESRLWKSAGRRWSRNGRAVSRAELTTMVSRVQRRYFDDADGPGRRALDGRLVSIIESDSTKALSAEQREQLMAVMRRFLRVPTTLVRCFPLGGLDTLSYEESVGTLLGYADSSSESWSAKFQGFLRFVCECSESERVGYLDAAQRTQTRGIRVEDDEEDGDRPPGSGSGHKQTLANVQVATGDTDRDVRTRLMRAFNTPFFPDIFVCSEVMGEGVDLQRSCRHVIHHDLSWSPSTIEQRTGRIDRLGCKAEGRQPILTYLPFLSGTADERQFRVMSDREQWFRVVMGQDEVAKLIAPDSRISAPLPKAIAEALSFRLEVIGLDR